LGGLQTPEGIVAVGQDIPALIAATFGNDECDRFLGYHPDSTDLQQSAKLGAEVLRRSPPQAGACTYITAMWAALLRDNLDLPAFAVAGDLWVRGVPAFGSSETAVARSLETSCDQWDGHCWLALGEFIGDASLFRTAYAQPEGSNLRIAVVEEFGLGKGLLLATSTDLRDSGFDFRPKYVLRDDQLSTLVEGAHRSGLLGG
jgi:hypothetical protein